VKTVAVSGKGTEDLAAAIQEYVKQAESSGVSEARRRERSLWRLVGLIRDRVLRWATKETSGDGALEEAAGRVFRREIDPYEAADAILGDFAERGAGIR
jgi:LAO/AO transport system kinase